MNLKVSWIILKQDRIFLLILPLTSLLGRPGSLKRPKPLIGSLFMSLFYLKKSLFQQKKMYFFSSFSLGSFLPFQQISFGKYSIILRERKKSIETLNTIIAKKKMVI